VDCGIGLSPAHSAAWHVGPAFGDLASWANSRSQDATQESSNSVAMNGRDKKMGCSTSTPKGHKRKIYRFFAAFFFPPLAAFFAIFFSSGCCDSASDEPLGRHYGWAEPSTLIPDVDYG
jgi:hypothetical protein